ncbi:hypothetical protein SAMN05216352_1481 [Alteribacillus bidgolensis]|uniref:Uncharacterized protein n=1 Tax=Alteribacillus bidgolensis TaxID=930129 RepID=A0A1G8S9S0_9BACI|nr:hypothetical protein [Alteribacillus bidgolensis]SDJ25959.1 hypothetical protein SAMN05216352_1481 [Alteribacillus bidgolensis]
MDPKKIAHDSMERMETAQNKEEESYRLRCNTIESVSMGKYKKRLLTYCPQHRSSPHAKRSILAMDGINVFNINTFDFHETAEYGSVRSVVGEYGD